MRKRAYLLAATWLLFVLTGVLAAGNEEPATGDTNAIIQEVPEAPAPAPEEAAPRSV